MSRRSTSSLSDDEIFAALRMLVAELGHIPSEPDINAAKDFPLNASGLRRRFRSLNRALLLAGVWFRQAQPAIHEPIDIGRLPMSSSVRELFESDATQVLHLNGLASIEEVLRAGFEQGAPVGGMFTTLVEGRPLWRSPGYYLWMRSQSLRVLDVTASARAYEAQGVLVMQSGHPYPGDIEVAMVVVYDLDAHGWVLDGRFAVPSSFSLDDYLRAHLTPATA